MQSIHQTSLSPDKIKTQPFNEDQGKSVQQMQNLSQSIPKSVTFKIKDSLYLASSLQAFYDEEFVLLNWIQYVIVFQNQNNPFNQNIKTFYGQQENQIPQPDQQSIKYIHCDQSIFKTTSILKNYKLENKQKCENKVSDRSPIKQIEDIQMFQIQRRLEPNFQSIYSFIQQAQQQGSSCLLITSSLDEDLHDSGCLFAISSAYLMQKYHWSLYKTLEYMNSRIKNAKITQKAYQFLTKLEITLLQQFNLTYSWQSHQSNQELVLKNTFINSQKVFWDKPYQKTQQEPNSSLSRQLKNTKIQHVKRKFKTQQSAIQDQFKYCLNLPKSILKEGLNRQKSKVYFQSGKKKVQFNLEFNQVKQFQIPNSDQQQVQAENLLKQGKINSQNLTPIKRQQNSINTSRRKRISLCVNKLISRYREQKKVQQKNNFSNMKKFYFDDFHQMNLKYMKKKKSFYNFDSSQKLKDIQKDNKQNQQIFNVFTKIKTQKQKQKSQKSLTQNNLTMPQQQSFQQAKVNCQNSQVKSSNNQSQKRQTIKSQVSSSKGFLKDSSTDKNTIFNPFQLSRESQPNIIRSKKSLFQLPTKNQKDSKDFSLNKSQNKTKNSSQLKNKQNTQKNRDKYHFSFIKGIKTTNLTQRKSFQNINMESFQNINMESKSKGKFKNILVQYEDFKEIIKSKQRSFGNLSTFSKQIENQKISQNRQKISSVIEKLKKDVEIQSSVKRQTKNDKNIKLKQSVKLAPQKLFDKWR